MINLDDYPLKGKLECPWCSHIVIYLYSESSGIQSFRCPMCKKMVLWDLGSLTADKATIKKINNRLSH